MGEPFRYGRKLYPDGPNNYLYCNNNPINHIDPLGLSIWDELKATFSSLENALAVGGAACQGFREGVVDTAVSMADVEAYKAGLDLLQKGNAFDKSVALLGMTAIAVDQATDIASLGSKAAVKKVLKEGASKVVKEVGDKLLNKVVKEVGSHAAVQETTETAADAIRKGAREAGGAPGKPVPNPAGQHGKLDHRTTVSELVDEAAGDFPGDIVHEGTSIKSKTGINRRPDVWVEDQVTGDVKKVYEAARANKGGSFASREVKKMQEYNKAGIPNRFKEVK